MANEVEVIPTDLAAQSGRELIKTLTKEAYLDASNVVAASDAARAEELRFKAFTLSGAKRLQKLAAKSVPKTLYGQNLSASLAVSRMGNRAVLRLGQYEDLAATEAKIFNLIKTLPFYGAFEQFTLSSVPEYLHQSLATAPEYVKQTLSFSPYHLSLALQTFEKNYASKQDARKAASWGVRFPEDLRADLAYSRLSMVPEEYNELYLGSYDAFSYDFDYTAPGAQEAKANLGPSPSIQVQDNTFNYFTKLNGATSILFYWYAHVWRSLQAFIPTLAKMLHDSEQPASDIYDVFKIPGLESPASFNLWVVAANTFMFERLNSPDSLRELMTDDLLHQVSDGFNDAAKVFKAESWFLQQAGMQIKAEIDLLSAIQFILKVLNIPAQVIYNLPKLAEIPVWYYIAGGVGAVVVLGGVLYVLRG